MGLSDLFVSLCHTVLVTSKCLFLAEFVKYSRREAEKGPAGDGRITSAAAIAIASIQRDQRPPCRGSVKTDPIYLLSDVIRLSCQPASGPSSRHRITR